MITGTLRRTAWLSALLLASTARAAVPQLAIALTPVADPAGTLATLQVAVRFDAMPGDTLAEIPVVVDDVTTSANAVGALAFSDARGALPVSVQDQAIDANDTTRRWKALRPVEGPVTIAYRVTIDPHQVEFAKPQYELRAADGALSGAGNAFLILPADQAARRTTVHWDLSQAGRGARAASSLGPADAPARDPMLRPDEVAGAYYMAGTIGAFARGPFFGAWQGHFAFDGNDLMNWAARLHVFYGDFFDQHPAQFGVFARTNHLNPGSGIGLTDSFAFTFGNDTPIGDLKSLLAHEMVHAWIHSLDGGVLDLSWFGEGLAVHYERLLPYRAGLISRQAFLDDLNETAGRYYTNALIATPNARIPEGFWRDTRVRVLPYDRGSLYFAAVDAKVRKASGNKRSLDDLVRAMLAERRAGHPFDIALWKRLLGAELGAPGLAEFDAMLSGQTVLPPSDAFGPCFERFTKPLKRFDLGFDPASLLTPTRAIAGLKPGSTAAAAGLRNGDRIITRFPQDRLQGDQTATLTLDVERDGHRFSVTYLPRGETVDAYQWRATCN